MSMQSLVPKPALKSGDPAPATESDPVQLPSSGGSRIRSLLRIVVPLLLFLGAIGALAGGGLQLASTQLTISWVPTLAAFSVLLLASGWAAVVWTYMARTFGARLDWRTGVKVYATSNLGKYLPGKVGHVVARVYLAQERGVPVAIGTTAAVVDIVLYIAAALAFAALALPTFLPAYGTSSALVAAAAVLVGLALLHPAVLNRVLGPLARRLPGGTRFHLQCGYGTILWLFALYVGLIAITTLGMLLSIAALQSLSAGTFASLGAIYGVSYLAGLIFPLAPNGIGIREGVMSAMLQGTVPVAVGVAASVLFRVLQVGAEALVALIASRL
jgi:glycosyltransferase 2 family protein